MVFRSSRRWSFLCVTILMINLFIYRKVFQKSTEQLVITRQDDVGFPGINCQAIMNGDFKKIDNLKDLTKQKWPFKSIREMDCTEYRKLHRYDDIFVTKEEQELRIAFNILFYKDLTQIEVLLRAIYRPQNSYCLHVDGFSPSEMHRSAKKLADCFNNIFIASKTLNITYGGFNRLQADINCMEDHLFTSPTWEYLINLPGQEFPLKTNSEMVQILKHLNKSNDIAGSNDADKIHWERYDNKYILNITKYSPHRLKMTKTKIKHEKPPHNLEIYKGSAYGIFSRQFVDYIVNNQVSHDLLNWCKDVYSPDEYFWAMLNYNQHLKVPGGYSGTQRSNIPHIAVYVAWHGCGSHDECHGKMKRCICVFSVRDLQNLVKKRELFVNKLDINYDPLALQCLSEWIHNKTVIPQTVDLQYYKSLPFIQHHF